MKQMIIEKMEGGYIITDSMGRNYIKTTLDEVFRDILLHFEGRSSFFYENSFGEVTINREKKPLNKTN